MGRLAFYCFSGGQLTACDRVLIRDGLEKLGADIDRLIAAESSAAVKPALSRKEAAPPRRRPFLLREGLWFLERGGREKKGRL